MKVSKFLGNESLGFEQTSSIREILAVAEIAHLSWDTS